MPIDYVMLSYNDNKEFAEGTAKMLKEQWDIDVNIVYGYKIGDKYNKYNVIMNGIQDILLPMTIEKGNDIVYLEDDCIFTEHPEKYINDNDDVVWLGYRKGKLTNKAPHNVITGSQAIFMNYHSQQIVLQHFKNRKRKIQIDGAFSEVFRQKNLSFRQVKNIAYEREHNSLISKKEDCIKYTQPH